MLTNPCQNFSLLRSGFSCLKHAFYLIFALSPSLRITTLELQKKWTWSWSQSNTATTWKGNASWYWIQSDLIQNAPRLLVTGSKKVFSCQFRQIQSLSYVYPKEFLIYPPSLALMTLNLSKANDCLLVYFLCKSMSFLKVNWSNSAENSVSLRTLIW
jgi:hypothetical protein